MAAVVDEGENSLQYLSSAEPPQYLSPSPDLSRHAREASRHLYASLLPFCHKPKPPIDALLVDESFDAEQIWCQIDLISRPLVSMLRRELRQIERDPPKVMTKAVPLEKEDVREQEEELAEDDEEEELDEEEEEEKEKEEEGEEEEESEEEEERELNGVEDEFFKLKGLEEFFEEEEEREFGGVEGKKKKKKKVVEEEEDNDDDEKDEEGDEDEDGDEEGNEDDFEVKIAVLRALSWCILLHCY